MEIVFLIIGIIIGAIIGRFLGILKNKENIDEITQNLNIEKENRIRAEAELKSIKSSYLEAQNQLKSTFEALAAKAMQNNNESFILLAKQTLEKYVNQAEGSFKAQKESVNMLLKPLKESLDKHEELVKNMQSESNKTFGSMRNYLEELGKNQNSLTKETHALVSALKAPKVRGRWGEIGLKRIVEFSGMSAYCDFKEQVNVNSDDGRMRPDMIVSLPNSKKIVIDSKVPLGAYLEALEADEEIHKKQFLENHSKAVQTHVKQLSSKAYWSQFDDTIDFVVLYIEVEPAFGAAMSLNNNLVVEAIQNRIVFATPTTLITLLQTVAFTWKQHQATENAQKIWLQAKETYQRIAVFTEHLQKMGTNINNLTKNYNQAVGSWESRVSPGLKKIEELGISSEKKQLEELIQIETSTRELKE
jgi:DNA recombination protein RmuC